MAAIPTRLALAGFLAAAPLLAQSTYYVDGVNGLDGPGRGASPALPWRTLTYAVANVTATATSPATVRITGGQSYSPTTNGESFPVTLPPDVALEGVAANGSLPLLDVPAGATGLELARAANHANAGIVHRNLIVQGGSFGVACGAEVGLTHRLVLEACEFRGQSAAGVRSIASGSSAFGSAAGTNDVTVRNCTLIGAGIATGVQQFVFATAGLQRLEVAGCTVRGWANGVLLDTFTSVSWSIATAVRDTTVSQCGNGLTFVTPYSQTTQSSARSTSLTVARTRISDCTNGVVDTDPPSPLASRTFTATDVAIARCSKGVAVLCVGPNSDGQYAPTWERAVFADCGTGIDVNPSSQGSVQMNLRNVDFLGCDDGIHAQAFSLGNATFDLERTRFLDGRRGMTVTGSPLYPVRITADDCIVARQSVHGIAGNAAVTDLNRCTLADCAVGIQGNACLGVAAACLLSGNGTDAALANAPVNGLRFATCATDGPAALPASATAPSFQFAALGLSRPNYKLLPGSPAIDFAALAGLDYEGDPRGVPATAGATVFGDLGADEYVPGGSLRPYGLRTFGNVAASPSIDSPSVAPAIGGSYTVQLNGATVPGATGPALAVLATGVRDSAGALPTELGVVGLPGCHLWLDPLVLQTLPPVAPSGTATASVALPFQPALLGFVLTHQWLVGLPVPDGFVTSNALRVTVGQ